MSMEEILLYRRGAACAAAASPELLGKSPSPHSHWRSSSQQGNPEVKNMYMSCKPRVRKVSRAILKVEYMKHKSRILG